MCMHVCLSVYMCIHVRRYECVFNCMLLRSCVAIDVSVCSAHVSTNGVLSNLSTSEVNHCQYEILIYHS